MFLYLITRVIRSVIKIIITMLNKNNDGVKFWSETLGAPKYILAPMVDASELAWRVLSRRYGAQLCYTPMLHSSVFARDPKYRKEALFTCDGDRPLIVQFCGNDPKIMLEAALLAEDFCDAVDINLGCPQAIAKRGHYGSFLQDEWELLHEIVSSLNKHLKVPVTCKVRIFDDMQKTINYAKMLEAAGCQILTVHGRTREQKGPLTGIANWDYVKEIKKVLNIPVISNGNIQCVQDVHRCLEETGVNGVMTAEGNLHNPALFTGKNPPVWEIATEYLDLVELYPCPSSYIRGHLFKLFHHLLTLEENFDLRIKLGAASDTESFKKITKILEDKYLPYHEGMQVWNQTTEQNSFNLILPVWLCQPYVRLPPEVHLKKVEENTKTVEESTFPKRHYEDTEGNTISRKRMKKLRRIQRRPEKPNSIQNKRGSDKCANCANTLGNKCIYKLCKKCCKSKCFKEELDCPGHRILVKTRRNIAKHFALLREDNSKSIKTDI